MSTTFHELIKDLAIRMGETRTGIIETVPSGNSFTDSDDPDSFDKWANGFVMMDGASTNNFARRLTKYSSGLYTFDGPSGSPAVDEEYTLVSNTIRLSKYKQAINQALRNIPVRVIDSTLTAAAGVCALGTIRDVKEVFVDDVRSYRWYESGGYIRFDDTAKAGALTIHYLAPCPALTDLDDVLDSSVDPRYAVWAAAEILWRERYEKFGKDDPIIVEFFNEAKVETEKWRNIHNKNLPAKEAHFPTW